MSNPGYLDYQVNRFGLWSAVVVIITSVVVMLLLLLQQVHYQVQ